MVASSQRSRRQVPVPDRITQAVQPVVDAVVLLVGAMALGTVLVAALVWILRTLGLVLA
jgi:hypothetical protein